jgi:hypothetical protein
MSGEMGLLSKILFGDDSDERKPWQPERQPAKIEIWYDDHDLDGAGWWVSRNGNREKHRTKEEAIRRAKQVAEEDDEILVADTFWGIHPPGKWDCWCVKQDPDIQADTKEEIVSGVLDQANEEDTIIIKNRDGDREHKLTVEEARELVR